MESGSRAEKHVEANTENEYMSDKKNETLTRTEIA